MFLAVPEQGKQADARCGFPPEERAIPIPVRLSGPGGEPGAITANARWLAGAHWHSTVPCAHRSLTGCRRTRHLAVLIRLGHRRMRCRFWPGPGVRPLSHPARTEQIYESVLLLGHRMKRLNTIALCSAALATALLMLVIAAGMLLRSGT